MGTLATKAGFAYNFGINGYFKLPAWLAGFILQWGIAQADVYGSFSVVTPITFPHAAFFTIATVKNYGLYNGVVCVNGGTSYVQGSCCHGENGTAFGLTTLSWFTIGY